MEVPKPLRYKNINNWLGREVPLQNIKITYFIESFPRIKGTSTINLLIITGYYVDLIVGTVTPGYDH